MTPIRITPVSRTVLVPQPLLTSQSLPSPAPHAEIPPSTWLEIPSDSDDEVVVHTSLPAEGRGSLPPVHSPVDWTAELGTGAQVLNTLPLALAQITLNESQLSRRGMCALLYLPV